MNDKRVLVLVVGQVLQAERRLTALLAAQEQVARKFVGTSDTRANFILRAFLQHPVSA